MTLSKRALANAAWLEWKVATDYSTGLGEVARATPHPPGGFVEIGLGFGFGEGPSLMATLDSMARAARNCKVLFGDGSMRMPGRRKRRASVDELRDRLVAKVRAA